MSQRRGLLAFAAAVFVGHHVPAYSGDFGTWLDLATPFLVLGVAAWALRGAPGAVVATALVGGILYADGHGIHLSANDVGHEQLSGHAEDVRHFWDERFGHIEWHLGWLVLLVAFCLADRRAARLGRVDALAGLVLGWSLFTNTVEGGDWGLTLAAAPLFVVWALARPRPTTTAVAGAAVLGSALIAIWAIWQGGVPQFSDVGWL